MCARCPAAWSADAQGNQQAQRCRFSEPGDLNLGRVFPVPRRADARGSWLVLCAAAGACLVRDAFHGHGESVAGDSVGAVGKPSCAHPGIALAAPRARLQVPPPNGSARSSDSWQWRRLQRVRQRCVSLLHVDEALRELTDSAGRSRPSRGFCGSDTYILCAGPGLDGAGAVRGACKPHECRQADDGEPAEVAGSAPRHWGSQPGAGLPRACACRTWSCSSSPSTLDGRCKRS
jgi:hypothetical protein